MYALCYITDTQNKFPPKFSGGDRKTQRGQGGVKMGFLRTDYSEVNSGFEPLPIGEYECIVSEVKVTETQSTKKPMLKVTLTVRDDVEQAGQKRKFFDNIVEQENMMWKFQQVAKAAQFPEGTDVESLAHFAELLQFKPVLIKNAHRDYNGEKQDSVKAWMETKTEGGDFGNPQGQIDISDDDLPF
jgi:hypothetical protein